MLMDFNHLFIKGIGPVMFRSGKKNPAANYTQNKYSKRDGFSVTPDSGIPFNSDMSNGMDGNSPGYGRAFQNKIDHAVELVQSQKKDVLHRT
jgi:hypothetical protein